LTRSNHSYFSNILHHGSSMITALICLRWVKYSSRDCRMLNSPWSKQGDSTRSLSTQVQVFKSINSPVMAVKCYFSHKVARCQACPSLLNMLKPCLTSLSQNSPQNNITSNGTDVLTRSFSSPGPNDNGCQGRFLRSFFLSFFN